MFGDSSTSIFYFFGERFVISAYFRVFGWSICVFRSLFCGFETEVKVKKQSLKCKNGQSCGGRIKQTMEGSCFVPKVGLGGGCGGS